MASETSSDGGLTSTYEVATDQNSTVEGGRNYWLFALGLIFGSLGVVLFLNSVSTGSLRQWAILLAAAGLVLILAAIPSRNSDRDTEPEENQRTVEVAELQQALAASEAKTADLEAEVEQLQADLADTEAVEAELAVLLK